MTDMTAHTAPRRAAILFILITVLLDMLSFGIIIPVLPKLVEEFLAGDTAKAAMIYGLMGTAWALMQFICSPIQGALSDHYGRRPVVLLSNLGLGLDYIVMALAPNVFWLIIGRTISGSLCFPNRFPRTAGWRFAGAGQIPSAPSCSCARTTNSLASPRWPSSAISPTRYSRARPSCTWDIATVGGRQALV